MEKERSRVRDLFEINYIETILNRKRLNHLNEIESKNEYKDI